MLSTHVGSISYKRANCHSQHRHTPIRPTPAHDEPREYDAGRGHLHTWLCGTARWPRRSELPRFFGNAHHPNPTKWTIERTLELDVQLPGKPEPLDPEERQARKRAAIKAWRQRVPDRLRKTPSPEQRTSNARTNQQYRKERNAVGLCLACSEKSRPGFTRCQPCSDKHRAYERRKARLTKRSSDQQPYKQDHNPNQPVQEVLWDNPIKG